MSPPFVKFIKQYSRTFAAIVVLGTSSLSFANEVYPVISPPTCNNWCGWYVGAQFGGSWMTANWKYTNANFFNTLDADFLGTHFDMNAKSFLGGANVGLLYQWNQVVLGGELSMDGAQLHANNSSPFFPTSDVYTTEVSYFTLARGRLGYAYKQFMTYLTGGYAGGGVYLRLKDNFDKITSRSKRWSNGWTAGAGVDYRVEPSFSIGLAYDYIQLVPGTHSVRCTSCGTGTGLGTPQAKARINTQVFSARANFYLLGQA
jgi:outer membrane immunogenic protein